MSQTTTLSRHSRARDVLTQTEAAQRAARVSDVAYEVRIDLVAGRSTYAGEALVRFTASGDASLFLDFRGKSIRRLELDGEPLEPEWTGYRLTLPGHLLGDRSELRIEYVNDYDVTGDGFHRFVDPEDDAEYVYTNFEPYEAHRLFPCFDQPDIKATYQFTVTAPTAWEVIANSPAVGTSPADGGRTTHRFEQTEVFSTYLVALCCGPYVQRSLEHNGQTLALYSRRSMERYLEEHAPEILEITAQGMDFYAKLFDRAYPFTKYDQVFVPEYNSGAMENVGCVTYNEAYLFRDNATDEERLDRGETFLHELAHMWFGNLVTMRWWDNLWLNESFATYISYLALTEATRFGSDAWKVFNSVIKRWAYQQDQLPTTHPISAHASDTEIAFLNFDGITYGKGASVLKQLVKHTGRDVFENGMQLYFRRHAWGNATLADFLGCLEEAGNISLGEWARLWLQTASLNTIAADWTAHDGRISELTLKQTAPATHPVLRPHSLEIALGHEIDGSLAVTSVAATIDGERQVVDAAAGVAEPDLVFPNHGDHDYAKIDLDARSVWTTSRNHVERVEEPLLRTLLWASLWQMVRDLQLRSSEYPRHLPSAAAHRDGPRHPRDRAGASGAWTVARYTPEARRVSEAHSWFEVRPGQSRFGARRRSAGAVGAVGDQRRLVTRGRRAAGGHVSRGEKIGGFELDQEMRWAVAVKAVAFGMPRCRAVRSEQQGHATHPTAAGGQMLRAEAARPTPVGQGSGLAAHPRRRLRFLPPHSRRDAGLLLAAAGGVARAVRRALLRRAARRLRDARPSVRALVPALALPRVSCRSGSARARAQPARAARRFAADAVAPARRSGRRARSTDQDPRSTPAG